jgi:hypothetical protein
LNNQPRVENLPRAEDLARAIERCEAARARSLAYGGKSEHMRRKLDAAVRSAEYDVSILRYAIREKGQAKRRDAG